MAPSSSTLKSTPSKAICDSMPSSPPPSSNSHLSLTNLLTSSSSSASSSDSSLYLEPLKPPFEPNGTMKFVDDPFENSQLQLSLDKDLRVDKVRDGKRRRRKGYRELERAYAQGPSSSSKEDEPDGQLGKNENDDEDEEEEEEEEQMLPIFPSEPSLDDVFSTPIRLRCDDTSRRYLAMRLLSLPPGSVDVENILIQNHQQNSASGKIERTKSKRVSMTSRLLGQKQSHPTSLLPVPESINIFLSVSAKDHAPVQFLRFALMALQATTNTDDVVNTILARAEKGDPKAEDDHGTVLRTVQLFGAAAECSTEQVVNVLCTGRVVCGVLKILKEYAQHPVITACSLAVFTSVLRRPSADRQAFVQGGGMEAVVWALDRYRAVRSIVTHGSTILRTITRYDGCGADHDKEDLKSLYKIEDDRTEDDDDDDEFDEHENNFPHHRSNYYQVRAARVGALSVLSDILAQWTSAPRILTIVIAAITSIVRGSHTAQWIAARSHLVQPLVTAMRQNIQEIMFQVVASRAVAALCDSEPGNRLRVFDADFLSHATSVLKLFSEDAQVAVAVLSTLSAALIGNHDMQDAFGSSGALQVTLQAITLHSENVTVTSSAAVVLGTALRAPMCRNLMQEYDGVDSLVDALSRGISRENIVAPVLYVLSKALHQKLEETDVDLSRDVSSITKNRRAPLSGTGRTADPSNQSGHTKGPDEENVGIGGVINAERFVAIDGLFVVTDAMHRHVQLSRVQYFGILVLRLATKAVPSLPPSVTDVAIQTAFVALSGHCFHRGVQTNGCGLLTQIAQRRDAGELNKIKNSGIVEIIEMTRTFHEDDDKVKSHVQELKKVLTASPLLRKWI